MKIIVLGSGIAGVTTAYFLAKAGHKVVVLEKNSAAGTGCSYANGGQLNFSHIEPWNSVPSLINIFKSSFYKNSFFSLNNKKDMEFYKWAYQFIKNSKNSDQTAEKILKLNVYSKANLANILREEKIDFNYQSEGILYFYRNQKSFNKAIKRAEKNKNLGIDFEILNSIQTVKKEPTLLKLVDDQKLAGSIFYKNDGSGDCYAFIQALEEICRNKFGVVFEYDTEIKNIFTNYKYITGINTGKGVFVGDQYVSCLGSYGNLLLKGVGIDTKIYPIKGYSLSIPVNKTFLAPSLPVHDPENKISCSRTGNIFRAAGTIEIDGLNPNINHRNIEFIKYILRSTYSDFGDISKAAQWCGYRPSRPDFLPIVCKVKKYDNLFINSGHGSMGWTHNFATSKIIANMIIKDSLNPEFAFLDEIEKEI